jgi:hypothetical protein
MRGQRQERTAHAARGLTRALAAVLTPAARQRGFTAATLLAEWRHVVGPALAARCQPTQLESRGGVLHLQASSAAALEIQHATPQIIERVNTYFGFVAVRRLRLVQVPLRLCPPPAEPITRPLVPAEAAAIENALAGVDEGPLRTALKGLGHSLRAVRR